MDYNERNSRVMGLFFMESIEHLSELYKKHGRVYKKGSAIFLENAFGGEMYFILEGTVQITKTYREFEFMRNTRLNYGTNVQVIATLNPNDFFGEMALLNEEARSASAVALENVKLIVVTKENFERVMLSSNTILLQILKSLSNRLRETIQYPRFIPEADSIKPFIVSKEYAQVEINKGATVETDMNDSLKDTIEEIRCPKCATLLPKYALYCLNCGIEIGKYRGNVK